MNNGQGQEAIRYFLGELTESEREQIENRFFADEDFSRFLDAAENDLIDDYARGELDAARRLKFEQHFLTSERRREKLRVAEVLQRQVLATLENQKTNQPAVSFWKRLGELFSFPQPAWGVAFAAAVLLTILGGVWLVLRRSGEPSPEIARTANVNQSPTPSPQISPVPETIANQSAQNSATSETGLTEQKQNGETSKLIDKKPEKTLPPREQPKAAPRAPQPVIASFVLLPPMRSSEKPILNVPQNAQTIRLRVVHDNREEFIKYRIEIRDSDGDLLWSREVPVNQKTLSRPLALSVRAGALASGAYELTLSGVTADGQFEEINFYNFNVQKK